MYKKYAKLRDARGMSDYAVAKQTNIPQSTIYDWRQRSEKDDKAALSIGNLRKIADLFGVSLEEFA